MKSFILICEGANISRATIAALLNAAGHDIIVVEREPQPDPVEAFRAAMSDTTNALKNFADARCLPEYYDYRDYDGEARQGIAEKRAWFAHRVSLILKLIRRFQVTTRRLIIQYAWSSRRWKSLT